MIPRSQQLGEPSYAPTFCPHDAATSPTFCPYEAATSRTFCMSTRQSQLLVLLRQLPSFRSCQVEPLTCTSRCALPNSYLRAGCQFLRCRIRICVQGANVFAAEFLDSPHSRLPMPLTSFPAWLGHSIVKPMFVNNLRCRFSFDEPSAA